MNKEFEVVELENGDKYVVVDAISYQDRVFILLNEYVDDENISDDAYIYEKVGKNIVEVKDEVLMEKLIAAFQKRLEELGK